MVKEWGTALVEALKGVGAGGSEAEVRSLAWLGLHTEVPQRATGAGQA